MYRQVIFCISINGEFIRIETFTKWSKQSWILAKIGSIFYSTVKSNADVIIRRWAKIRMGDNRRIRQWKYQENQYVLKMYATKSIVLNFLRSQLCRVDAETRIHQSESFEFISDESRFHRFSTRSLDGWFHSRKLLESLLRYSNALIVPDTIRSENTSRCAASRCVVDVTISITSTYIRDPANLECGSRRIYD